MDDSFEKTPVRMTNNLRKQLIDISDSNCILVKFSNKENDDYEVAFASWLKGNKNNELDIMSLIDTNKVTILYLPVDLSIQCSKLLSKFLGKAKFTEESVTVLSTGDWVTMKSELKSIRNTGLINVTINSRKRVMKKPEATPPVKPCAVKDKALKSAKSTSREQQDKDILNKQTKLKQHEDFTWTDFEKIDGTINSNAKKNSSNGSQTVSIGTNDSGLGDVEDSIISPVKKKSKKNSGFRGAQDDSVSPPPKVKKTGKKKPKRDVSPKVLINSEDENANQISDTEENNVFTPPKVKRTEKYNKTISAIPEKSQVKKTAKEVRAKIKPHQVDSFSPAKLASPKIKDSSMDSFSELEDDIDLDNQKVGEGNIKYEDFKSNVRIERRSSIVTNPRAEDKKETSELPLGVKRAPPLPDAIIKACLSRRKIQSFVSGLCDNFFEKSYLAAHSPTGQVPNLFVQMGIKPKPALYPPVVEYIRELVTTHFGNQVGVKGKVTKALSDKISTARPKKKGPTTASATGDGD